MQLITKTPGLLVIRMDANESLANGIRRSIAEVPTLAIEEAEIFKNDSAIYDEMLAHRLGLIPLKTEKSMNSKTKVEFKLSKTGPCTVYASDLEDSEKIVEGKIPITLLRNGHKLELVATATLGLGINHAKYIPGLCYYRHIVEVVSNSEIDEIIKNSKGFIKPEKKGSKWICDLNEGDVEKVLAKHKDAISDSNELILVIESFGQMDAKDIFLKALDALEGNLDEVQKALK
ncbi:DNA-directed RNA polymerase subunit D [Candidatus Pacearchaeota archaeon CG10_big_fil_rev_8_21_14_0_10_31_24]|nr:MAG: DNA-directed RNA polymerase subunit D [Candidatus Pacearchaeota archaeon CG10_big_fil_rev_8_21_14_0_10_31_24]